MDELIKNVNKNFDGELINIGLPTYSYDRVPFTSPRLNYMTYGGMPIGCLVEFYGENGGGKTTTALDVVANYQIMNTGKKVFYCDCENTLDTKWAKKLGVDTDDLYLFQPTNQSAEDIFQTILEAIETDEIGLVVIDSIGVMLSQQAMDKDIQEKTYGGISMPLTTFSKKAEGLCKKHRCLLIGINQVRENLNSPYGGKTTPGGLAWKHNVAVRLEFRKGKFIDEKGNEISKNSENPQGNKIEVAMIKNKTCPPDRHLANYTIRYLSGIDYLADLVEVCIAYGIVEKKGAWFTIIDIETGEILKEKIQGQANVYAFLSAEENIEILQRMEYLVDSQVY